LPQYVADNHSILARGTAGSPSRNEEGAILKRQEARFVADPWEEKIAAHIQNLSRVTVGMVAKDALFIETARISMRDSYRIIDVLTSLGWTMTRSNGARWYKPRDSAA
jgi:hypothetical protein